MSGTRVTCTDLESGESESIEFRNDWMIVTDGRAYVHHINRYANGTAVITVKVAADDSSIEQTEEEK